MDFLYFLEDLRAPWLTEILLLITRLGEETAFLVIALIVFWCVDKYKGYYTLGVGLAGTLINQFLKITCRVPRPWMLDENFSIVESAREAASGYSFPSGHTQTAVGTFGAIAAFAKQTWVRITMIVLAVLVGFSRMYLGVHTPADVIVGAVQSVAMVLLLLPMMHEKGKKWIPGVFAALLILTGVYVAYVTLYPFPENIDAHNYESAFKNAYTLMGCSVGILVVWFVDEKKLHFDTKAVWWAQILKVVFGLAAVLLVKEGLRSPLEALFSGHMMARAVRYCFVVMMAGIIWPLSFRWFGVMGKQKEEK